MPRRSASAFLRLRWCASHVRLLCVATVICGCSGSDGPPRKPVYGTVTDPMVDTFEGAISFLPLPETKGPSATTAIVSGKYRFDATDGPIPGKYEVLIVPKLTKSIPTADTPASKDGDAESSSSSEIKLAATVPDKAPFELNFNLPSK